MYTTALPTLKLQKKKIVIFVPITLFFIDQVVTTTHLAYGITPLYNELEQLLSTTESVTDIPTIVLHNDCKKIFSCEFVAWVKN